MHICRKLSKSSVTSISNKSGSLITPSTPGVVEPIITSQCHSIPLTEIQRPPSLPTPSTLSLTTTPTIIHEIDVQKVIRETISQEVKNTLIPVLQGQLDIFSPSNTNGFSTPAPLPSTAQLVVSPTIDRQSLDGSSVKDRSSANVSRQQFSHRLPVSYENSIKNVMNQIESQLKCFWTSPQSTGSQSHSMDEYVNLVHVGEELRPIPTLDTAQITPISKSQVDAIQIHELSSISLMLEKTLQAEHETTVQVLQSLLDKQKSSPAIATIKSPSNETNSITTTNVSKLTPTPTVASPNILSNSKVNSANKSVAPSTPLQSTSRLQGVSTVDVLIEKERLRELREPIIVQSAKKAVKSTSSSTTSKKLNTAVSYKKETIIPRDSSNKAAYLFQMSPWEKRTTK